METKSKMPLEVKDDFLRKIAEIDSQDKKAKQDLEKLNYELKLIQKEVVLKLAHDYKSEFLQD